MYAEGDQFLGVDAKGCLAVAKKYNPKLSFTNLTELLHSPIHEERMVALRVLRQRYPRATKTEQCRIYQFYLNHLTGINNWDLVDVSASAIIGEHLLRQSRRQLYRLAASPSLWRRRIAIVATYAFIREDEFTDTLANRGNTDERYP